MTQADPSEPEADDYVADTAADGHVDLDDTLAAAQQRQPAAADTAAALPQRSGGDPSVATEVYGAAVPAEPAVTGSKTHSGRGAGTPAGPQDEFYSPPEHFNGDVAEHRDSLMQNAADIPRMHNAAQDAAQATAEPSDKAEALQSVAGQANAVAETAAAAQQSTFEDAQQPQALPDDATASDEQQAAASAAKTPMPAKTPANPKRRKGTKRYSDQHLTLHCCLCLLWLWIEVHACNQLTLCTIKKLQQRLIDMTWLACSVPPSSKRRKATPAALTGEKIQLCSNQFAPGRHKM